MQPSKIKTLLIDNDQGSKAALEKIFHDIGIDVDLVGKCSSADEAIEQIQVLKPDLVLLDIEIPGKNGFEVLKAFDNPIFKVIIVSKNDQYALSAIKFAVFDYVLKPFDCNELKASLSKITRRVEFANEEHKTLSPIVTKNQNSSGKIIIPTNKGFHTLMHDRIESITAQSGNYCLFKLTDNSFDIVTKPLTYLEGLLPGNRFFRVHRSAMINLLKIESYKSKRGIVRMESGDEFEVAVRRRRSFILKAKKCISSRYRNSI